MSSDQSQTTPLFGFELSGGVSDVDTRPLLQECSLCFGEGECPECDGTGTDTEEAVCTFCSGSGICHDCQGEEV